MGVTLLIDLYNEGSCFYSGQVIQGKVTLSTDIEIKIKGLTVTIFGDAEVYWTEAEAQSDTVSPHRNIYASNSQNSSVSRNRHIHKEFRNQETLLCHEIVLLGQGEEEGGTEFLLTPGKKEFTFEYQLPLYGIPSTFTDVPFGFIRYFVEARLKRPLFRYDKTEKEFIVKEILDINSIPRVLQPFGVENRVDFGWICCPNGYMSVDVRLPKTGYIPGESIHFTVSIMNFNREPLHQIFAALTQEIQFKTFDKIKKMSSDKQFVSLQSVVEPYDVVRINESFTVPNSLPPSTLAGCRAITLEYSINVTAKTSSNVCKAVCPIFIGTEPHDTFQTLPLPNLDSEASVSSWVNTTLDYDPALNPFLESEEDNDDGLNSAVTVKKINTNIGNIEIDGLQD